MKKITKISGFVILVLILVLTIGWIFQKNDIQKEKISDLEIAGTSKGSIKAGFAAIPVTPDVPDKWTDINNDATFKPKDGDTFTDGNGNGRFDAVWIAGFGNARAANGVHDDLWARTMVISDGNAKLAIVSLDAIGFMNPDVNDVRKQIPEDLKIDYLIISSTHTHEGPDLLGLWGKSPFKSGVNNAYKDFVKGRIVESVVTATRNLTEARLEFSEDLNGAAHLVTDTRKPDFYDSGLRMIKAINRKDGNTLGTLVNWGNHPETLWSKNLLITSDFPHYFREGVEKGVFNGDSLVKKGVGGTMVYVTGAVGGLMTTHPRIVVKDPFTGKEFKEPTFEKAEAEGKQLSLLALNAMEKPLEGIDSASISIFSRKLEMPLKNRLFKLGLLLGVFERKESGSKSMITEIAACRIGPFSIATFPGEVYPEIINGKVEAPIGRDFNIEPVETPSIRELMPGKYKFVFGLANDEIGYIIPKSQWDVKAPYTYERKDSPYGEENSIGPETAPILYKNLKELIEKLH